KTRHGPDGAEAVRAARAVVGPGPDPGSPRHYRGGRASGCRAATARHPCCRTPAGSAERAGGRREGGAVSVSLVEWLDRPAIAQRERFARWLANRPSGAVAANTAVCGRRVAREPAGAVCGAGPSICRL